MDSRLLVPATAALLDGWCGPALAEDSDGNWAPVVVIALARPDLLAAWVVDLDLDALDDRADQIAEDCDGRIAELVSFVHLSLDLSRAECRSRVALLLAPLMGLGRVDSACGMPGRTWYLTHGLAWSEAYEGSGWRRYPDSCEDVLADIPVEGDDTRLPDGSRWVDAAALAAVAREVLRG